MYLPLNVKAVDRRTYAFRIVRPAAAKVHRRQEPSALLAVVLWAVRRRSKDETMTSLGRTMCVLVLGCGFAGSALAAMDSAGSTSGQNAAPSAQAPSRISQRLHDDLTKAGFTDITIMPSSFLVRAKDSQGNPVMMVINPDAFTEMTEHSQGTEHKDAPLAGAIKGEPNSPIPSPPPKQ
jgi:hypothetical protein